MNGRWADMVSRHRDKAGFLPRFQRRTKGRKPKSICSGLALLGMLLLVGCKYSVERPKDPFLDAAFRGNVRELETLAAGGVDPVTANSSACRRMGLCKTKKPVNIRVTDPETGKNALHYAAYKDNQRALRFLLKAGVPVNQKDDQGMTPLFDALEHEGAMTLLLQAKASVAVHSKEGSLLNFALQRSVHPNRFVQLAKAGAKAEKNLIWDFADSYPRDEEEADVILSVLIEAGAKLNWTSPIEKEKRFPLKKSTKKKEEEISQLEHLSDPQGKTALHQAVLANNPVFVNALLRHGADPTIKDKYGYTPLTLALEFQKEMQPEWAAQAKSKDKAEADLGRKELADAKEIQESLGAK